MLKRRANSQPTRLGGKPKASPEPRAKAKPKTVKAQPTAITTAPALPDLDQPAVNANEPTISYKTHFKDHDTFYFSRDGGKTNHPVGSNIIAGKPINLYVVATKATNRDGFDYRLRFGFIDLNGELAELNLNACNVDRNGSMYVTSPVRSLLGSLLEASQSEDDMAAVANGVRFCLTPGGRGGLFITMDAALGSNWISFGGATSTSQVPSNPDDFFSTMALIKSRFHGLDLLPDDKVFHGAIPQLPPAQSA